MNLQQKIIYELGVKSKIDPKFEFEISVTFLKNYFKKNKNLYTLVLGMSGGQDSTLTGKICHKTVVDLRKETKSNNYCFIAVYLPYGKQKDEDDYLDAISFVKPDKIININIKNIIQIGNLNLKNSGIILNDNAKLNQKSRERMKIQYSIANMTSGIVIGTNHASESIMGFFTKYGDGGSDINPISKLNKRQGRYILEYLSCPKHLILKKPTADLEEDNPSLPDEDVFGITYDIIDDYLEGKKINKKDKKIIENYYISTKHKRNKPIINNNNF